DDRLGAQRDHDRSARRVRRRGRSGRFLAGGWRRACRDDPRAPAGPDGKRRHNGLALFRGSRPHERSCRMRDQDGSVDEIEPKTSRRGIWGWMFFDWAAQPFFTVVTTFVFGPYFVARMASDPAAGQAAWSYGIAAAGFVIAILSPVLGSIADQTGPRKPWI